MRNLYDVGPPREIHRGTRSSPVVKSPMKRLPFSLLSSLFVMACLSPPALVGREQQPRFATVDMQVLIAKYHRAVELRTGIQESRFITDRMDEERIKAIEILQWKVKRRQAKADDPAIGEIARRDVLNEIKLKKLEVAALNRERLEFLERRKRSLKEKEAQRMARIRKEIQEVVAQQAKELKFDVVFDTSDLGDGDQERWEGNGLPDLTPEVLKILNKGAPRAAASTPAK